MIGALSGLLSAWPTYADALTDLNDIFEFTDLYAAKAKRQDLLRTVPVFVNRFGNIKFYRPGTETPEEFNMRPGIYNDAKAVAHIPITILARFAASAPVGTGRALSGDETAWLGNYARQIGRAPV